MILYLCVCVRVGKAGVQYIDLDRLHTLFTLRPSSRPTTQTWRKSAGLECESV